MISLQCGYVQFSQTVLFSFLRRPFPPGWGGLCHGCLRHCFARGALNSMLNANCQFFFLTVQNSVINSYRSLYSLPGSTSTFLLLLLLSASTLIVKTFEDGDGDSLKVNEKCVKNDDTKKNNNTVVKLKLLQYVVSEIAKSSLKVLVSNKDTNNVRAPKKVSSSLLAARCRSTTRARRR